MTKTVTASTARAKLGAIVDQAAHGSTFNITNRGTPSAVILGISEFLKATGLTRDIALSLKDLDDGKSKRLDRRTLQRIKTRGEARLSTSRGKMPHS